MNKAILFCTVLFIVPLLYQEADAIVGQEIQNFTPSYDGYLQDFNDSESCFVTSGFIGRSNNGDTNLVGGEDQAQDPVDCYRAFWEFDISLIPDSATILDVTWFEVRKESHGLPTCTIHEVDLRPSTVDFNDADILAHWNDLGSDTQYVSNSSFCSAPDFSVDLGAAADTDVTNSLVNDWFAFSMRRGAEGVNPSETFGVFWTVEAAVPLNRPQLQITYTNTIDPVDTLFVTKFELTGVDLGWVEPNTDGGILEGYQINFTTPHGDPITPITNNTFSLLTTATITNLLSDTNYTFRVTAVTEGLNKNVDGKLLNITTIGLGNFTIGFADLDADNFDARDIKYRRIDEANDITKLEVVYPNAFNLTCTFDYRFQNTNQTFSNLVTVPESTDGGGLPSLAEQKATFTFVNASKEIIGVVCTDVNTNASAPFLLTISIINQLLDFRAGEFGTDGMLGAIDIITLGVVVMVMIGFNRWNESVGAIFAVGMLGGLSFFQIVEWQTFMFGTFAVVIMVVIGSTRKD